MIKRMAAVLSVIVATAGLLVSARADEAAATAGIRRIGGRVDNPEFIVGGLESNLQRGDVKAWGGDRLLSVDTVTPMPHPPTDFLVLIDVSASTKSAKFDLKQVMGIIIDRMSPDDGMEIATFGDNDFDLQVPLTRDTRTLKGGLDKIQKSSTCTKLYQALIRAADRRLIGNLAPATTGRNALLVVLSDGKDDDPDRARGPRRGGLCNPGPDPQTSLVTAQAKMILADVPLLFVDTTAESAGPCIGQFATQIVTRSDRPDRRGGQCVRPVDAGEAVRKMTAVTRIETKCADCPNGAKTYKLEVITQGGLLRLTRDAELTATPPPKPDQVPPPPPKLDPVPPPPKVEKSLFEQILAQPWLLLACVLVLALIGVVVFLAVLRPLRRIKNTAGADFTRQPGIVRVVASPQEHLAGHIDVAPVPLPALNAEFVQLGNYGTEQRFHVAITEQPISLGRDTRCDIVLAHDPAVADTQCEFVRDAGKVLVRNLAPDGAVLLDGASIPAGTGWRWLRHGDVLRVANTELRFADLERTV